MIDASIWSSLSLFVMVSHTFSLKSVLQYEPYIVFTPKHRSDSGTNSPRAERKRFRVRKLRDSLEGKDASGTIPSLVSRLHPVCIRWGQIDLRLQGTLTSRSTSDLAFGSQFGMLKAGTDALP